MSNRERWIVYPLLFFALLLAAKDQVTAVKPINMEPQDLVCGRLIAQTIDCAELRATSVIGRGLEAIDNDDRVRVRLLGDAADGGLVTCFGGEGQHLVAIGSDPNGQFGVMETNQADGGTMVRLTVNAFGGVMETLNPDGQLLVRMAGNEQGGQVNSHAPNESEKPSLREEPTDNQPNSGN